MYFVFFAFCIMHMHMHMYMYMYTHMCKYMCMFIYRRTTKPFSTRTGIDSSSPTSAMLHRCIAVGVHHWRRKDVKAGALNRCLVYHQSKHM